MDLSVLLIDDEEAHREDYSALLSSIGVAEVITKKNGDEALELSDQQLTRLDVALIDNNLSQSREGLQLGKLLRERAQHLVTILLTAYGSDEIIIEAIRDHGFSNYLSKPARESSIKKALEHAEEVLELRRELFATKKREQEAERRAEEAEQSLREARARQLVPGAPPLDECPASLPARAQFFAGKSLEMRPLLWAIKQYSGSDVTFHLEGETGTGKTKLAHAVHYLSSRSSGPFQYINCARVHGDSSLIESTLFGSAKGSYTSSVALRKGRIASADGGTLLIDEIGDLPLAIQGMLLDFLQDGEFYRVGDDQKQKADVRIITATNKNLRQLVSAGKFREDLFYRVSGQLPVTLPPLRQRPEDIPAFIEYVEREWKEKHTKRQLAKITPSARRALFDYSWPGNVRELETVVERIHELRSGQTLDEPDIRPFLAGKEPLVDLSQNDEPASSEAPRKDQGNRHRLGDVEVLMPVDLYKDGVDCAERLNYYEDYATQIVESGNKVNWAELERIIVSSDREPPYGPGQQNIGRFFRVHAGTIIDLGISNPKLWPTLRKTVWPRSR